MLTSGKPRTPRDLRALADEMQNQDWSKRVTFLRTELLKDDRETPINCDLFAAVVQVAFEKVSDAEHGTITREVTTLITRLEANSLKARIVGFLGKTLYKV